MIDDAKWIQINQVAADWKEALSIACTPLIIHGAAEPNYLQGIIKNTQSWGPYYLIAPALLCHMHVRNKGLSITKLLSQP